MELVGIFLLLAPLGALILYLRRTADVTAREAVLAGVAGTAPAFAEPAPPVEPEADRVEAAVQFVDEDQPRRAQL